MKKRVKVEMEKQVKKPTRASPMNTAEQDHRTKPERRLVSDLKHLSFATNLMVLANKALDEDKSLPAVIEKDTYEQAASQRKRELVIQQKAKSLGTNHKATKALKEAKLNRGLELYKNYKKRVNESGLGACRRVVGNNLCGTLKELSFEHLVVLANAASIACAREVSRAKESKEVVVRVGVEEHKCKQRVSGDMDCGGSCFGLSEELQRNQELMQQRSKAGAMSVVEEVKPNRDPSDGCREDKLFKKKYVRRKRVKNQDHLESSTSTGAVAGTSNLVKKLCRHKSSSFINVDAAERREEELLCHNGDTQSKSEKSNCNGTKNKTKSKAQSRDETEATAAVVSRKKHFDYPYSVWERGYPKRKRSQLIRQSKEQRKNLDKKVCDQIDTCDVSEQEAETEEEDVSDASNSSSRNPWSSFFFNVQWSNKKKRNCMKLEERQRNRKILVLAVEAITHQLCRVDISM